MKLLFSHFTAPALVAALALLAGCSSDNPSGGNTGGTSSGGSAAGSGGKGGSAGSVSVGGAGAGGTSAGGSAAGGSAGSGTAGSATAGSSAAGGTAIEASFATVKDIITLQCFGNGCHGQEGNPLIMKLDDTLYTTLTTHTTKNCGKLVNPTSPAESALVKLLKGSCGTPPNVTDRMPFGGSCLEGDMETDPDATTCVVPAKIDAIQAWIAKGAPKQ